MAWAVYYGGHVALNNYILTHKLLFIQELKAPLSEISDILEWNIRKRSAAERNYLVRIPSSFTRGPKADLSTSSTRCWIKKKPIRAAHFA